MPICRSCSHACSDRLNGLRGESYRRVRLVSDFDGLRSDTAHLQYRETEHISFRVYLLHDLVVGRLPEVAWSLVEEHLEVVALRVVPELHSVSGHRLHPRLMLSVMYAVRTNASSAPILTTTHRCFAPTTVPL